MKIHTSYTILLIICQLFLAMTVKSQQILIDEDFADWLSVQYVHNDKSGDNGVSGIDFTTCRIHHDEDYIYMYLEIGRSMNFDAGNNITLYIDIDNNPSTGFLRNGIGAEIRYNFGTRSGNLYLPNRTLNLRHHDFGLVFAPTVTSDRFELVIRRKFTLSGQLISINDKIRLLWEDMIPNGDALPDTPGGLEYELIPATPFTSKSFDIDKKSPESFRLMSYNVERDALFNPNNQPHFRRIIQTLNPDIIGFQEIYDNNTATTRALVESFLPGNTWFGAGIWPDIKLISKYPIERSSALDGNGAFLVNMGISKALIIITHLPCCENDTGRQREIDRIMGFVRDCKNGLTDFKISEKDPIIIMGDMNFVGDSRQVRTLLEGEIQNTTLFGPRFRPDWDNENLADVKGITTGLPTVFTWYTENSSFSPGRLDYMTYTASNLELINSFNLFTPGLSTQELLQYGLLAQDVLSASDHLPLIADFQYKLNNSYSMPDYSLQPQLKIRPNPVHHTLNIEFQELTNRKVNFEIFNSIGIKIHEFDVINDTRVVEYDVSHLTTGEYLLQIVQFDRAYTLKFVKI